jgi:hypothetical protein
MSDMLNAGAAPGMLTTADANLMASAGTAQPPLHQRRLAVADGDQRGEIKINHREQAFEGGGDRKARNAHAARSAEVARDGYGDISGDPLGAHTTNAGPALKVSADK